MIVVDGLDLIGGIAGFGDGLRFWIAVCVGGPGVVVGEGGGAVAADTGGDSTFGIAAGLELGGDHGAGSERAI